MYFGCKNIVIGIVLIILNKIYLTESQYFSAISGMEKLIFTRARIIINLEAHIVKERNRLDILENHLNNYINHQLIAQENVNKYLENPINTFKLIKMLNIDFEHLKENIKIGKDIAENSDLLINLYELPSAEDYNGALQALHRLKETYLLEEEDLSEGIISSEIANQRNTFRESLPLTAEDCYELGRYEYSIGKYNSSLKWMMISLRKIEKLDTTFIEKADILDYISYTYYELGDYRNGIQWVEKLLQLNPTHSRGLNNLQFFQSLSNEKSLNTNENVVINENKYEALCRGDYAISSKIASKLKCKYETGKHPFLRLAPIKYEEVYLEPNIVLFHDVISDDDISGIQEMAAPYFKRAGVRNTTTGETLFSDVRISKHAWFNDNSSPAVARLSERLTDMTGLDMSTAEDLQVGNYGIGGHYNFHYDFSLKNEALFDNYEGNRIATVLIYVSKHKYFKTSVRCLMCI